MYWRISSFPELDHLADDERRVLLRRYAGRKLMIGLLARSICGGVLLILLGGGIAGSVFSWRPSWPLLVYLVPLLVPGAIALVYQYHLIRLRGALIVYLEEAARHQRLPMCLRCGYNLKGISGSRCPECGYRLNRTSKTDTPAEQQSEGR